MLTFLLRVPQGSSVGSNIWVNKWTADPVMKKPNGTDFETARNTYLGVYGAFGGAQGKGCAVPHTVQLQTASAERSQLNRPHPLAVAALFSMTSSFVFAIGCIASSLDLHNRMFQRMMRCPMSFFDMTPIGRILNRFTKDIDNVDNVIPLQIRQTLNLFFSVRPSPALLELLVRVGLASR